MYDNDYIAFLRWCLNRKGQAPSCVERINWRSLLSFAKEQTIVGIYWQGIQRLGDVANKSTEDDVMEWMGASTQIVRRNAMTNEAVANLAKFMQSNDIDFFVFKGQTIASYYPLPENRTSGDVDFYVFKKDWERARLLFEQKYHLTDEQDGQAWSFVMDRVPCEMHFRTVVFASKSKQHYWDKEVELIRDVDTLADIDGVAQFGELPDDILVRRLPGRLVRVSNGG